jgi:hypothetical protein
MTRLRSIRRHRTTPSFSRSGPAATICGKYYRQFEITRRRWSCSTIRFLKGSRWLGNPCDQFVPNPVTAKGGLRNRAPTIRLGNLACDTEVKWLLLAKPIRTHLDIVNRSTFNIWMDLNSNRAMVELALAVRLFLSAGVGLEGGRGSQRGRSRPLAFATEYNY